MQRLVLLPGQKFSRLTVLGSAGTNNLGKSIWRVLCECGKEAIALGAELRSGHTKSCGCLMLEGKPIRHGFSNRCGKAKPPAEYLLWVNMRQRCEDQNHPHYKNYGGRGIKVCEQWHVFETFYAELQSEIGLKPPNPEGKIGRRYWSLDRKNNDGNYEPGNIRWANPTEQRLNQRRIVHGPKQSKPQPVNSNPQS